MRGEDLATLRMATETVGGGEAWPQWGGGAPERGPTGPGTPPRRPRG
jgi:hypothetical protein